jgi:hypothetical protein
MKEAVPDPFHNQPRTFLSNHLKKLADCWAEVSRRKESILEINVPLISVA